MSDEALNLLSQNPFFQHGWNQTNLEVLAKAFSKTNFKAGEVLVQEGNTVTRAFFVVEGSLARYSKGKIIDEKRKGDMTGLHHLFETEPSFATVVAKVDSVCYVLTADSIREVFTKHPELQFSMLSSMSYSNRQQTKMIRSLANEGGGFRVAFFDSKPFWRQPFLNALEKKGNPFQVSFLQHKLDLETVPQGYDAVCIFVNDKADSQVVQKLRKNHVGLIALRCAGFNNVDRKQAAAQNVSILRVPAYSPYAVAEHSVALLLTLNRKIHIAANRIRDGNFSLSGLVGFDIFGKTVGLFGTGKIGRCALNIWKGFGCKVLLHDLYPIKELECENVKYVPLDELLKNSDIVTLHCPLTPQTQGLFNAQTFEKMKQGATLINTSRGALINTKDLIKALESGKLRGAGIDVYENENQYFFEDLSNQNVIEDETLSRLTSFKNVIVTGHQAFLTEEALQNIADTTVQNIIDYQNNQFEKSPNIVNENTF